jgi:3-oxoacyl-[acyl-carrier-protein] synthase III
MASPGPAGIRVAGTGSHLPGPPIDQDGVRAFLRRHPDGLGEAMQERLLAESGIQTRHFAIDVHDESRRETNTSMAVEAGRRALAAAGWQPADVELLVVTTVVPDQLMPPTSTLVQEALGIARCAEVEISANCSAPYKGIAFAAGQLRLGECRRALVCCSQYSSVLLRPPWANPARMEPTHGALRWIVSDGAGALALERGEPDTGLRVWLESSGCGERSGMSLALGAAFPDLVGLFERGAHHVVQDDRFVLRVGVRRALDAVERMLRDLGVDPATLDHFLPAVSSMQVARGFERLLAERCGIRPESWRLGLERTGYIGGVGGLVLLDEMARSGSLRPGATICSFAEESSKWMAAGLALRWNP